ncbi:uncharacterized protein METZ01_LOCUS397967 [marine metagenome]|uniref:Uncharacterized protein n=1 Tax=marine metagenome TaxID=408172 RepID=A0A382VF35_9ZZZZ
MIEFSVASRLALNISLKSIIPIIKVGHNITVDAILAQGFTKTYSGNRKDIV